jgi:hypothetical protein
MVHRHDAVQRRIDDCTHALMAQGKICGALLDARFELIVRVAQCPLGSRSAGKVPADRQQRQANQSAREKPTPDNDCLGSRGTSVSQSTALPEQGSLGLRHLIDEAANPIVKLFAFPGENLALRRCITLSSPQFDDFLQFRKSIGNERHHRVEPLLLDAVVRRQLE